MLTRSLLPHRPTTVWLTSSVNLSPSYIFFLWFPKTRTRTIFEWHGRIANAKRARTQVNYHYRCKWLHSLLLLFRKVSVLERDRQSKFYWQAIHTAAQEMQRTCCGCVECEKYLSSGHANFYDMHGFLSASEPWPCDERRHYATIQEFAKCIIEMLCMDLTQASNSKIQANKEKEDLHVRNRKHEEYKKRKSVEDEVLDLFSNSLPNVHSFSVCLGEGNSTCTGRSEQAGRRRGPSIRNVWLHYTFVSHFARENDERKRRDAISNIHSIWSRTRCVHHVR